MSGITIGNAKERMAKLFPSHQLWQTSQFQRWYSEESKALDDFQRRAFELVGARGAKRDQILSTMDLEPPENAEEDLRNFQIVKAVIRFWRGKLESIKAQSREYEQLEQQIRESRQEYARR